LVILLLAWQALALEPSPGLTASWQAGIEMALHNGVPFGPQVVFTYGPLGFFSVPQLWYGGLGTLSFVYTLAIRFALAAALFGAGRQTFGRIAAFVIAVMIASLELQLVEPVLILIVAVRIIDSGVTGRRALLIAAGTGAFAGVEFLNKESLGISIGVMVAVLVLGLPERRRAAGALAAASGVLMLVFGWLVTGQSLGDLPTYMHNVVPVISGYAAAMSLSDPTLAWEYTAAFLTLAFGIWGALHMTGDQTARGRRAIVALWVVFWFFAFKEGFVRQDLYHGLIFFQAVLGGLLAFHWRASHRSVAAVMLATALGLTLAAEQQSLTSGVDPVRNVRDAVRDLGHVVSSSQRDELIADGRAQIRRSEPIDPRSLADLTGRTVAVYPVELALAWAYRLRWDPLPVLQGYSAYTSHLDELDANYITSSHAPQRILFDQPVPIDGRVLSFEEPMTSRTMLCNYRLVRSDPTQALLAHAGNRCGPATLLGTATAGWAQSVPVPQPEPHELVFVRVGGVAVSGIEEIRAALWKPAERFIVINGVASRLVGATAPDGLPLSAAPGVDFPRPFAIAPRAKSIAVTEDGQEPTRDRAITYSFYRVRVGR
jgi:hypothetical protein